MMIHESSFLKSGSGYGPADSATPPAWEPDAALSILASAIATALKLTTNSPEPFRKSLREVVPFHFPITSLICFGMLVKVVMRPPPRPKPLGHPLPAWRHA